MNKKNARKKTNQPIEEVVPASSMPPRRKRGRPRKHPLPEAPTPAELVPELPAEVELEAPAAEPEPAAEALVVDAEPLRRKRGRPRKHPLLEAPEATVATEPETTEPAVEALEPEALAPLADIVLNVAPEDEMPTEPAPELPSEVELETPVAEPETAEPEPAAEALDVEAEPPAPLADVVLNVAPEEPAPELPFEAELEAPVAEPEATEPELGTEALDVEAEPPAPFADVVLNVAPEDEAPEDPAPELPSEAELETPVTEPETAEPEPAAEALDVEPEDETPAEPAPELPSEVELEASVVEPEPAVEALDGKADTPESEAPSTAEEKLMDDIAAAMTEPHPPAEPDALEAEFPKDEAPEEPLLVAEAASPERPAEEPVADATEMDVSSLLVAEPAAAEPEPTAVVPEREAEGGMLQAEEEGLGEAGAPAPEGSTLEAEPEPEGPQVEEEGHDEADAPVPEEPAPEAEPETEGPQVEEEGYDEADTPAPEGSTPEAEPETEAPQAEEEEHDGAPAPEEPAHEAEPEEIHESLQDAESAEATEEDTAMGLKDKLLARKEAPVAQEGAARPRGGVLLPLLTFLLLAAVVLCWLQLRGLTTLLRANRTPEARTAASAGTLQQDERYEYAIDFLLDDRITAGMDERGKAGWRLVGSRRTQDSTTGQYGYEFIFMRPAQKE